jgi:hypothetical protein
MDPAGAAAQSCCCAGFSCACHPNGGQLVARAKGRGAGGAQGKISAPQTANHWRKGAGLARQAKWRKGESGRASERASERGGKSPRTSPSLAPMTSSRRESRFHIDAE